MIRLMDSERDKRKDLFFFSPKEWINGCQWLYNIKRKGVLQVMFCAFWKWVNWHFCGNEAEWWVGWERFPRSRHLWHRTGKCGVLDYLAQVRVFQPHCCGGCCTGTPEACLQGTEEKSTLLLCSHSMYPCTRMHVYRHVHTVQMQHTEKPCCCLIAFNPHLMCAFAEGTMENVFWWALLPSVGEMGTVGARACSPLSISLCYRRFL